MLVGKSNEKALKMLFLVITAKLNLSIFPASRVLNSSIDNNKFKYPHLV
jgi:hypothetical protein